MGHDTIYYEITITLITLPVVGFFLYLYHRELPTRKTLTIHQLTVTLGILWLELASQLFTELWQPIHIMNFHLPPVHIILELSLVAYLSSTLWDTWKKESGID